MSVVDESSIANPQTEVAAPRKRSLLPLLIIVLVLIGGFFFGRNFLSNAQVTGEEQGRTAMRKFLRSAFKTGKQTAVADGVGTPEAEAQAAELIKKYKGMVGARQIEVKHVSLMGDSTEGQAIGEFIAGIGYLQLKTSGGKVTEIKVKSFNTERLARPSAG